MSFTHSTSPRNKMDFTHGRAENEGCSLHYYSSAKTGPLITFIPGGNGHGRQYDAIMRALSPKYTTLTFDRRQMSASTVKTPTPFSFAQQARDVAAVIHALGFTKSIIFGSSAGGIIAFQFAIDFPDMVELLVSHEAPTYNLLPTSAEFLEFFKKCLELFRTSGVAAAEELFLSRFIGFDDPSVPQCLAQEPENVINFWEYEVQAMLNVPDISRVKALGTKVVLMRGQRSGEAWYAQTTVAQARVLGCEVVMMPGHHQGFEVELEAFLPRFLEVLDTKEGKD